MSAEYIEYSIKTLQEVGRDIEAATPSDLDDSLLLLEHVVDFIHETNSLLVQAQLLNGHSYHTSQRITSELGDLIACGQGISFAEFKQRAKHFLEGILHFLKRWHQELYQF